MHIRVDGWITEKIADLKQRFEHSKHLKTVIVWTSQIHQSCPVLLIRHPDSKSEQKVTSYIQTIIQVSSHRHLLYYHILHITTTT